MSAMKTKPTHFDPNRAERQKSGKAMRRRVPRSALARWKVHAKGRDPIALLQHSDHERIPALLPLRYRRMLESPFAFLRGAAAVMAFDLARGPITGLRVQACGDCHLLNFGAFATPERRLVFDINDFDETLPAPWEWDLQRLAASIVLAGRSRGFPERQSAEAVLAAVRTYREKMAEYARWPRLQVWYASIDAEQVVEIASRPAQVEAHDQKRGKKAANLSASPLPKLLEEKKGNYRIKDDPPRTYHPARAKTFFKLFRDATLRYRKSLPTERRALFDTYRVIDAAVKVVGVGSVGKICSVVLLEADTDDQVLLQVKQASASVLEPYAGKSGFRNQGERVVVGQRMMQSASDLFLGWSKIGTPPLDFYFRQLRDVKVSVDLAILHIAEFTDYAHYCAWALARAHAKTGDAATIAGYLGGNDAFDESMRRFATIYADQTERDHAALAKAVKAGRVPVNSQYSG
jgi:uncharacterized protein (DUF2252 family)